MNKYIFKLKSGGYFPEPAVYSIMLGMDNTEVVEVTGINPQIICNAMNLAYNTGYANGTIETAHRIVQEVIND